MFRQLSRLIEVISPRSGASRILDLNSQFCNFLLKICVLDLRRLQLSFELSISSLKKHLSLICHKLGRGSSFGECCLLSLSELGNQIIFLLNGELQGVVGRPQLEHLLPDIQKVLHCLNVVLLHYFLRYSLLLVIYVL